MSQEWMLELISDLRKVAETSGFYELSEHLDDALIVAAREVRHASVTAGAFGCDGMGEELSGSPRSCDQP